jgi:hypothetical protein
MRIDDLQIFVLLLRDINSRDVEISGVPAGVSSCAVFGFLPIFAMPAILSRDLELF